jgi:hypothetical protein
MDAHYAKSLLVEIRQFTIAFHVRTGLGEKLILKTSGVMCLRIQLRRCAFITFRSVNVVGFGSIQGQNSCAIFSTMEQQELIEKITRLPQDSVAEVEDFVDSLARREGILNRKSLHQALTNYAIQHAGTNADLDSDLEAAATDHLLQQDSEQ